MEAGTTGLHTDAPQVSDLLEHDPLVAGERPPGLLGNLDRVRKQGSAHHLVEDEVRSDDRRDHGNVDDRVSE